MAQTVAHSWDPTACVYAILWLQYHWVGPQPVCLLFSRNLAGAQAGGPHGLFACIISRHTGWGPAGAQDFEVSKNHPVSFFSIKYGIWKTSKIPIVWESKFILLEKHYGSLYTNFSRKPYPISMFRDQNVDRPRLRRRIRFVRIFSCKYCSTSKINVLVICRIRHARWPSET